MNMMNNSAERKVQFRLQETSTRIWKGGTLSYLLNDITRADEC